MSSAARVLLALVAGLLAGTAILRSQERTLLALASTIEPLGALWLNAIRMTVIPLVVSLLVARIASDRSTSVNRIGSRALLLFITFVVGASVFAAAVGPRVVAAMRFDASTVTAARSAASRSTVDIPSFRDWLVSIVPPNVVKAAADDTMLPLIIFTALFACAVARVSAERRDLLVRFFGAVAEAMSILVGWILALAPLGVFVLALSLALRGGADIGRALSQFVIAVSALLVMATLALYPIVTLFGGVSLRRFARACAPVQAVALSTRSSFASLPVMLAAAEQRLELPPQVSGLILPAAVSLFKFGAPILRLTGMIFVARLYGFQFGSVAVAAMAGAVAALSFYTPGIPSGGLLVAAPVFTAFGLPLEALGLLIAVDLIPDMFVTAANVTADMAVVTLLSRWSRKVHEQSKDRRQPVVQQSRQITPEPTPSRRWPEPRSGTEPVGGNPPQEERPCHNDQAPALCCG